MHKKIKTDSDPYIDTQNRPTSFYDIYNQLLTHAKVIISASQLAELNCRKMVLQEGSPILNAALTYNDIEIAITQPQVNILQMTNVSTSANIEDIKNDNTNGSSKKKSYNSKKSKLDFTDSDQGVEIPKVSPYIWHIKSEDDDEQDHFAMEFGS